MGRKYTNLEDFNHDLDHESLLDENDPLSEEDLEILHQIAPPPKAPAQRPKRPKA